MTESEATEEALDVARPSKEESQDENEDSENEGCSIMEREKVTASEANAAVRLLRDFIRRQQRNGRCPGKRNSPVPFNYGGHISCH